MIMLKVQYMFFKPQPHTEQLPHDPSLKRQPLHCQSAVLRADPKSHQKASFPALKPQPHLSRNPALNGMACTRKHLHFECVPYTWGWLVKSKLSKRGSIFILGIFCIFGPHHFRISTVAPTAWEYEIWPGYRQKLRAFCPAYEWLRRVFHVDRPSLVRSTLFDWSGVVYDHVRTPSSSYKITSATLLLSSFSISRGYICLAHRHKILKYITNQWYEKRCNDLGEIMVQDTEFPAHVAGNTL
jgi:hypothetical protein